MSIVKSRLDNDLYTYTMQKVIREHFPNHWMRYELFNRSHLYTRLEDYIDPDELQEELDAIIDTQFTDDELKYLSSLPYFTQTDVEAFNRVELPRPIVVFTNNWFNVVVEGPWQEAIFWETHILSAITELYGRKRMREAEGYEDALPKTMVDTFMSKRKYLSEHPEVRFSDFGTRRRHSATTHAAIVDVLKLDLPEQFTGTSNVDIAHRYEVPVIGTMAHQLFMVRAAQATSARDLRNATLEVLDSWLETYENHPQLHVALTDTFTTDFFIRHVPDYFFDRYTGLRQDSGDSLYWGGQMLRKLHHSLGVPDEDFVKFNKRLVFSDGLNPKKMVEITRQLGSHADVAFGWGTNLTNDFGYKPLNIVLKPTRADGRPCIKLSDEPGKATGPEWRIAELTKWSQE